MSTATRQRSVSRSAADLGLMLCTLVERPFDDPAWLFEPKLDGVRVLCRCDAGKSKSVQMLSRNGKPQNSLFPEVAAGLAAAAKRPTLLDGEIVSLDASGRSSFERLQQRFHLTNPADIRLRGQRFPACIYLFDILELDGEDLRDRPLSQRKPLLRNAVQWSPVVRFTDGTPARGIALFEQACRAGGEGIIAKRLDSPYLPGRSPDWLKIKCGHRQEFVIGGFTDPQRTRVGLGALLVGYYDDGGRLVYAGKVGTSYTREDLLDLRARLDAIGQRDEPFAAGAAPPRGEGVHWARPELVAEIAFGEWTQNGLLRQPRFQGIRMDKKPRQVKRERPVSAAAATRAAGKRTAGRSAGAAPSRRSRRPAPDRRGSPSRRGRPLAEYAAKRHFDRTAEPGPTRARDAAAPRGAHIFVIQKHDATRLHYDLRLEAEGVLKSWAVPKEPTLDPGVKRLAVQVEDHPLAYGSFEGTIPEGEYGAGTVEIWDRGTYTLLQNKRPIEGDAAEGVQLGRLEFELHGQRLNGAFALVRLRPRPQDRGKSNWLLMKLRDRYAKPGAAAAEQTSKGSGTETQPRRKSRRATRSAATSPNRAVRGSAAPEPVEWTHTDKLMFPDDRITKGDVLEFYQRIAPWLLPELRDRPASLERLPDGLTGGRFWQKNLSASVPAWIPRIELPTETGKTVRYPLVNNEHALLYLVNQDTLTFHPWLSRTGSLDVPDYVLFDLDPPENEFAAAVRIAKVVRDALKAEGWGDDASVKTSGKRGLHILAPWSPSRGGFDDARQWAKTIAARVVDEHPDLATTQISKAKRNGRIYIDVLQNARGKHVVPAYVLRTTPGATVSTPLEWRELTPRLDPRRFTIKTIFRRLEKNSHR